MKCTQTTIRTHDDERLLVRHYAPAGCETPRTLVLVHGLGEHGEHYDPIARLAVQRGWRVILADHRGHGRSTGTKTHVKHFRQYVVDIDRICRSFDCCPRRTYLIGHSMGGLVSARYAQMFPDRLAGLVLIAPLLGIKVPIPWRRIAVGRLLSVVAPRARLKTSIKPVDVTRNPGAWERKVNDPLIRRSVTARWFFAMREAIQDVWLDSSQGRCPLLLVQGGQDRLVDPDRARMWFERLNVSDKSLHWLPESYHDVLSEPDWEHTVDRITDWLRDQEIHRRRAVRWNQPRFLPVATARVDRTVSSLGGLQTQTQFEVLNSG